MRKRTWRKRAALALGAALCICMTVGCGQGGGSAPGTDQIPGRAAEPGQEQPQYMTDDNAGNPGAERIPVLEGRESYDLLSGTWNEAQKAVPAPSWWNLTAYRENLLPDMDDMTVSMKYRAVEGKDYYILACYDDYSEGGETLQRQYYLNHIDGDTLETECHQLYLEELGLEQSRG